MMCNPPNPAIRSAVPHDAGANSATVPAPMNATPITGTMRTEYAPAAITPAPYSNIQTPGSNPSIPRNTHARVSAAPTSIAGAKASTSFCPGPDSSGTLAERALCDVANAEMPPATAASTIQTATHRCGVGWTAAISAASTALAPMTISPQPDTAVNVAARSIVSRMNRRLSIARACTSGGGADGRRGGAEVDIRCIMTSMGDVGKYFARQRTAAPAAFIHTPHTRPSVAAPPHPTPPSPRYLPRVSIIPLFGHDTLRRRLDAARQRGVLPGSLLLHGPAGVGKQRLALWLGQALLCSASATRPCGECQHCRYALTGTHPDLHWIFPRPRLKDGDASADDVNTDYADAIAERVAAGGLYTAPGGSEGIHVATVRTLVHAAAIAPAMAARKVFVIGDAERMVSQEGADQAANAFLKLLEEPPANTTIILTTSEPGALLPTVRSRVMAVRVPRLADSDMDQFLGDPRVVQHLQSLSLPAAREDRLRIANGAPGALLAQAALGDALARARRLLDAATRGDRGDRMRVAFVQGSAKARGEFSDALDALTMLLHDRSRQAAARSDASTALSAARAVQVVERAKEHAAGNANPQLVTFTLLRELEALLR